MERAKSKETVIRVPFCWMNFLSKRCLKETISQEITDFRRLVIENLFETFKVTDKIAESELLGKHCKSKEGV
jgi:hypothetical protein